MRRYSGWLFIITLSLMSIGCNKSESEQTTAVVSDTNAQSAPTDTEAKPPVKLEGPKQTVYDFLEACRRGDDEKVNSLLSTVAQKKASEMGRGLTPTASDTARFSVDSVKYLGEDGAHVGITWTDTALDGSTSSDKAVWVLRKEGEDWRVVGLAVVVVEGEDPVVLNFEDPADVKKKLEEISTRLNGPQEPGETDTLQAEQKEPTEDSVRR